MLHYACGSVAKHTIFMFKSQLCQASRHQKPPHERHPRIWKGILEFPTAFHYGIKGRVNLLHSRMDGVIFIDLKLITSFLLKLVKEKALQICSNDLINTVSSDC